ncbi:MAG: hypothetical protein EXR07_19575 [Acetobacteraceae bacterium]|nr:hypothetical protein [Acetobacteraceae bacterium]
MTMKRRAVLAAAGVALLPTRASAHDDLAAHGRRLGALLTSPNLARPIATAYLRATGETDWHRAAHALDMTPVLAPAAELLEEATLRTWLGERIRADFAEGRVVSVDGWRLSRTEVGACVIVMGAA